MAGCWGVIVDQGVVLIVSVFSVLSYTVEDISSACSICGVEISGDTSTGVRKLTTAGIDVRPEAEIDCDGVVLARGFTDMHNHSERCS